MSCRLPPPPLPFCSFSFFSFFFFPVKAASNHHGRLYRFSFFFFVPICPIYNLPLKTYVFFSRALNPHRRRRRRRRLVQVPFLASSYSPNRLFLPFLSLLFFFCFTLIVCLVFFFFLKIPKKKKKTIKNNLAYTFHHFLRNQYRSYLLSISGVISIF